MKIRCVWEHNGDDSILYADNFVGAYTRGESKDIALQKMMREVISYLEDRLGNVFPVRNQCRDCYNVVYNTSPLSLLHHYQDICRLQPAGARLSFTIEGAGEMEQVFGWYRKAILGGIRQEQYGRGFTNGHWKRGVE